MKKGALLLLTFFLFFSLGLFSQTENKKWGIGINGGTNEYVGELGSDLFKLPFYGYGGITIGRYLNPSFDLGIGLTYGDLGLWKDNNHNFLTRKLDGSLNLFYKFNNGYIIKEESKISPYLMLGVGLANYTNSRGWLSVDNDLIVPAAVGVKYHLNDWLSLKYQFAYNFTNNDARDILATSQSGMKDGYFQQEIGIVFNLGKAKDTDGDGVADKYDKCPGTPAGVAVDQNGCPHDKDGDGVADYLDKCPDVKGLASLDGCPDRDGDGITDHLDECPDVKGLAQFGGCPDTDGDGIPDHLDKCPKEKGLAEFGGCPDTDGDGIPDYEDECPNVKGLPEFAGCPDTDGDGIPDHLDKCPKVFGIAANKGCPEVKEEIKKVFEQALTGIQFETGSDVIKRTSFSILDQVVNVMKENPEYFLQINGHTDNVGDDQNNMNLSDRRANSVMKYIIDKGIDNSKMAAKGYGESLPIEDNNTPAGRAKNRRVEFKVIF